MTEKTTEDLIREKLEKELAKDNPDDDLLQKLREDIADLKYDRGRQELEKQAKEVLEQLPPEIAERFRDIISSPELLEVAKSFIPEKPAKKPATGKATLLKQEGETGDQSSVMEIFRILDSRTSTKEERIEAQHKLDLLWRGVLKNPRTLKKGMEEMPSFVMSCPKCGSTMTSKTCSQCGYELHERRRR